MVLKIVRYAQKLYPSKNICLAGGVALNCVANERILAAGIFDRVWIQPAAGDAGGALGAALAAHHIWLGVDRTPNPDDNMSGSYLGPAYSELDAKRMARIFQAPYREYESFDNICSDVAQLLAEGNIIGWMQGRMEWGPRALGNRSILADARNPQMQKKLNLSIKYRESFRPFAPAVLEEDAQQYFELREKTSPYMLFTTPVVKHRHSYTKQNSDESLMERINAVRSDVPAVTHLDYSARVQTVSRKTNERFWQLINAFKNCTGYGLLVNTSFNVRGEPIVMTPEDAYNCFMNTKMDYFVIGNIVFDKRVQPTWRKRSTLELYALD